jgi:hypothetical protein
VERINPGLLALIIHATAAQEKTNKALGEKGSQYRISEMYLTVAIPAGEPVKKTSKRQGLGAGPG